MTRACPAIAASDAAAAGRVQRLPFLDEEHVSRHVHFVKLSKNALPPAPTGPLKVYAQKQSLPNASSSKRRTPTSKTTKGNNSSGCTSSKAAQKPAQRIANLCDTDLWGFPVYFSPTREVNAQWELVIQNAQVNSLKNQLLNSSEQEAVTRADVASIGSEDLERRSRRDYAQYLYFAAKYGPLDTVLYCCTSLPGHVYALLVEQSARKLQQWSKERIKALRNYWIARLSRQLSGSCIARGTQALLQSFEHQQRAVRFLRRLHWHFAAKALRNWFEYTQLQIEIKWRFNFSAGQDLRARFQCWKEHVNAVKTFKKQLKGVAKRKRMGDVFSQWQQWKSHQEHARQLLVRRWMKTQRECLATWSTHVKLRKNANRVAIIIQRHWRGFWERTKYQRQRHAGHLLVRVARGWQARRRVRDLREVMAVGQTLLQLTRLVAWRERCSTLHGVRECILARELERAREEAVCVRSAEEEAVAFVSTELDKVVQNQMHQRLQENLKWLSESGEASEAVRANRGKFIQFATKKLTEELQRESGSRATAQFRVLKPENAPFEGCPVCHAALTTLCDDSEMRRIALFGSAHVCSQFFCGKDTLETTAAMLEALREQELAYEHELLREAFPIPVLWSELYLA